MAGGEFTCNLTSPRSKSKRKEKLEGIPVQQLVQLEAKMEGVEEEEGSDNKVMAKKTARKGKRVLKKNSTRLSQLEEEMELGFIEPAVPIPFKEVKENIFEPTPPGWSLEDS